MRSRRDGPTCCRPPTTSPNSMPFASGWARRDRRFTCAGAVRTSTSRMAPREMALQQPDVRVFERTSDLLRYLKQLKSQERAAEDAGGTTSGASAMIRTAIGCVAGPVLAGAIAVARPCDEWPSTASPQQARADVIWKVRYRGLDLARVRVAEGCRLPLLPEFVAITLGHTIYVRGHLARRPDDPAGARTDPCAPVHGTRLAWHDGRLRDALAAIRVRQAPDGSGGT